jgi:hypothetical protein
VGGHERPTRPPPPREFFSEIPMVKPLFRPDTYPSQTTMIEAIDVFRTLYLLKYPERAAKYVDNSMMDNACYWLGRMEACAAFGLL